MSFTGRFLYEDCFLSFTLQLLVDFFYFFLVDVIRSSPDDQVDKTKFYNDGDVEADLDWEPAS